MWYNIQRCQLRDWDHRDAEEVLRTARRHPSHSFSEMNDKILSVFVDESGNFGYPDSVSRFYVVALVFHDQFKSIDTAVKDLDLAFRDMGISHHYFHAGPMIRREKGYEFMDWDFRRKIFSRIMAFARKVDFRFACLFVDKHYVDSAGAIKQKLETQLRELLDKNAAYIGDFDRLKIYYDCGQAEVTKILHEILEERLARRIEFAQGVIPQKYKMFQIADLMCTIKLIEKKINLGLHLTESEERFFGGARDFKRNILKAFKHNEF